MTVSVDPEETRALQEEWDRRRHPGAAQGARLAVPRGHRPGHRLRRAASGAAARATWSRCSSRSTSSGHWWEHLLHNQSALRLKGRLLFTPGVMVTSVPWQLKSSAGGSADRVEGTAPGAARRGDVGRGGGLS